MNDRIVWMTDIFDSTFSLKILGFDSDLRGMIKTHFKHVF